MFSFVRHCLLHVVCMDWGCFIYVVVELFVCVCEMFFPMVFAGFAGFSRFVNCAFVVLSLPGACFPYDVLL